MIRRAFHAQDNLIAFVGTSSKELDSLISVQPRTKEDFVDFSEKIIEYIIKRHQSKPLYSKVLNFFCTSLLGC